jgi:hypothetical protein
MNKNIYIIIILLFVSSCSDFLDTEPLTNKVNTNFYQTHEDVNQALIGIYSVLNPGTSHLHSFFISELMSDDRFGGGAAAMQLYMQSLNSGTMGMICICIHGSRITEVFSEQICS